MSQCPVCETGVILPPNGVCAECYDHEKSAYVHSYEQISEHEHAAEQAMVRLGSSPTFDTEHNIEFEMEWEAKEWNELTGDGLPATKVLTDIVDGADHLPDETQWHCRRIALVADLIRILPPSLFAPATPSQIEEYVDDATKFWNGKLAHSDKDAIFTDFMALLHKTDPLQWDAKSLLSLIMLEPDQLDWIWDQFFESVVFCVPHELDDNTWAGLFHQYFPEAIRSWVNRADAQHIVTNPPPPDS